MKECFVCLDSTPPLYNPCECTMCIHSHCFEELVRRVPSHDGRCPVCLSVYTMSVRRKSYDVKVCVFYFVSVLAIILHIIVWAWLGEDVYSNMPSIIVFRLTMILVSILFATTLIIHVVVCATNRLFLFYHRGASVQPHGLIEP